MCRVWCESGECPIGFPALQGPEALQGHPRSHLGGLPVWVSLDSCGEGERPSLCSLPPSPSSLALSTGASSSAPLDIHLFPPPAICLAGLAQACCPWQPPPTCRLPHACFLCHQSGSVVPLPAAHSLTFLTGVLSNSWHQWPGSEPRVGCWLLSGLGFF